MSPCGTPRVTNKSEESEEGVTKSCAPTSCACQSIWMKKTNEVKILWQVGICSHTTNSDLKITCHATSPPSGPSAKWWTRTSPCHCAFSTMSEIGTPRSRACAWGVVKCSRDDAFMPTVSFASELICTRSISSWFKLNTYKYPFENSCAHAHPMTCCLLLRMYAHVFLSLYVYLIDVA